MSKSCCHAPIVDRHRNHSGYRRILWIVLALNATMFAVEMIMGVASGSASLQADALDFLGDSANYGISLSVTGLSLGYRARAALLKGITMGLLGVWVLASTAWYAVHGIFPAAGTMGIVGTAALLTNAAAFGLLWAYRSGDSNMRSAWICSRNDVIGNFAVLLAALGVFGTSKGWPDLLVAVIMGSLGVHGAWQIIRTAWKEVASVPLLAHSLNEQ